MLQNIHSWSICSVKCFTFCHECLLIYNIIIEHIFDHNIDIITPHMRELVPATSP